MQAREAGLLREIIEAGFAPVGHLWKEFSRQLIESMILGDTFSHGTSTHPNFSSPAWSDHSYG